MAAKASEGPRPKVTPGSLVQDKRQGRRITMLTAYDWLTAGLLEQAGVDILLVGDSCGMVVHGYDSTLPMTMEHMLMHTAAVARAARSAMVVGDMPFLSYQVSEAEGVANAGRFLQEAGADAVKVEGGERTAGLIRRLVEAGIPVMGHLGLTPQSVKAFGGYKVQAKESEDRKRLIRESHTLEEAGVFSLVLEKIPADLAAQVSKELTIPTIGIGAGPGCDGQVLVTPDMLGLFEEFRPKFVRRYAELADTVRSAVERYVRDVQTGEFPAESESY